MKTTKIWITGIVGATVACLACVAGPALLLILGGGALAAVTSWLGYVVVPIVLLSAALGYYLWYRGQKNSRAARQVEQAP